MKKVQGKMDELLSLYESKIAGLKKLIANQKKQLMVLDYGKGEISAGIARGNEKIIHSLVELDRKIEKIAENIPGNEAIIEITHSVFELVDEARHNQELIQKKMEECLHEIKRDLNTIQVKKQLVRHLNETRIWQSSHC